MKFWGVEEGKGSKIQAMKRFIFGRGNASRVQLLSSDTFKIALPFFFLTMIKGPLRHMCQLSEMFPLNFILQ